MEPSVKTVKTAYLFLQLFFFSSSHSSAVKIQVTNLTSVFCLQGQKPSCSLFSFSVCSLRETHMLLLCWDWLLMILTKHWVSVMWALRFFPLSVFSLKGKLVFLTIWHSAGGFQSERDWFDISTSEAFQQFDLKEVPQSVIVSLWI